MKFKKCLIFGAKGQLGTEFCRQLGECAVPVDLPEGDITNRFAVEEIFSGVKPDAVLNAAAFTAVEREASENAKAKTETENE